MKKWYQIIAEAIEKYCGEEMEAVDMFKHKK